MRYFVTARVKPGLEPALRAAVDSGTLGAGSVAEGEYLRNMGQARRRPDGSVCWVEVCFCETPLEEERPYWEQFFQLQRVQAAQRPERCRDMNGSEPWACGDCDCTVRLERRLAKTGTAFLASLGSDRPAGDSAK